uniref:Elongation factor P n=1 Tax=Opuntia streptacantha TaxID=393608 RepID=A0A7C8YSR3_OPUST
MRSDLTMIIKRVARAVLFSVTATTSATTISATNTKFNNRVLASLLSSTSLSSSLLLTRTLITCVGRKIPASCPPSAPVDGLLASPSWSFYQRRGSKVLGSEVRAGNIVQRKGRVYQVLKAQHTQHGRGGASIQVELRDVDSGNKVTERFRTDEAIERIFVEEKSLKYLYSEGDMVVLTDPETFDQIEVPKELFGKAAVYLEDDMTVTVQYFDERPMSASVPHRVTCKVVEAQTPMKGLSVNPQYKKVLLDNGLTVLAPPFIVAGDEIVVNTTDDSYITRAK